MINDAGHPSNKTTFTAAKRQGLYDPRFEHDSCGVAFVADLSGHPSHDIVQKGLSAVCNLEHRGASGAEPDTGDGAGILIQMPHEFLAEITGQSLGFELPSPGEYASGIAFLPKEQDDYLRVIAEAARLAKQEGLKVLGWREVEIDDTQPGPSARRVMGRFAQVFISWDAAGQTRWKENDTTDIKGGIAYTSTPLDRAAWVLRKRIEHSVEGVYFPSLSTRTLVYKGMLTSSQLPNFYADLSDKRLKSALALVHSRFSTNTFPSWPLAHPYRVLCHNGEINTLIGNRNWMTARENLLKTQLVPGDLSRIFPICTPGASDSASFDEVLELLYMGGRSLPHSVLMMIPEAWENHTSMSPSKRAFYEFHASMMEPWDGPAFIAFSDGILVGAVLDRNGLRPGRWWLTSDGLVIMASETGVLEIDHSKVVQKGRMQPGRMFLANLETHRIIQDDEIKRELASQHPYQQWLDKHRIYLTDLPPKQMLVPVHSVLLTHKRLFGYTEEELRIILTPMAQNGAEPIGSMGNDTPLAVLSNRPRILFDYFTQLFAQVTNPPLDAIREEMVTSLWPRVGPEGNLLRATETSCKQIVLPHPVIDTDELAKLVYVNEEGELPGFKPFVIDGLFPVGTNPRVLRSEEREPADIGTLGARLKNALDDICMKIDNAISQGSNVIVLSDRHYTKELAPIPSLLLVSTVHHHLTREKLRTKVGLIVECGDAREVHHMALLIGYGAAAVNPYLACDTIRDMVRSGHLGKTGNRDVEERKAVQNYIKAASKGVLKVMSKMGISTVQSYTGAQVFEAIGLKQELVDEYFTGTTSRLGGIGLDEIARDIETRHRFAYQEHHETLPTLELAEGGEYQWRRNGEYHLFNPFTIFKLQYSCQSGNYQLFKEYTKAIDDQSTQLATLRGLMRLRTAGEVRPPVPIEEVEPVSDIVKRFATGAMSYGSISQEAHETLAIAMNRIGARSNTGEGGEDPDRWITLESGGLMRGFEASAKHGDSKRSAIKQVASGRFGVTSEYLVNADDLQIKIAQGAKPGEGGQLPGHKVWPWIAKTRFSTPGVGLISPPPHHDIYSIEDIAQLIYDLKNANPKARIHVKLVAEVGVGTVAAGVAKAHSDVVLISGHDGGTGASPLTSLKHAGGPWELGLAETQQTLIMNGLRDRIVVQVDGQLKTGRDVIIAALLGAEEFGFATTALVVMGCVMMRVCHLDTCPVGIATQNPVLRKRFRGRSEDVVNFFEFIAAEVREYLAALGFQSLEEAIGHVEMLDTMGAIDHYKAGSLDLSPILAMPDFTRGYPKTLHCTRSQDHRLDLALDNLFIAHCKPALEDAKPVKFEAQIRNVNRSLGTMLGYELTKRYGGDGLPDDTIKLHLKGSAGQSFGAFVPRGITMYLEGDANDYFAKGLSGGKLVMFPPAEAPFAPEENIICGNVALYGATSGEVYIQGQAGERFCVRNSGALAVVEGVGDHGCEYMTGGRVVILGKVGRNFAAGMSGGVAFILNIKDTDNALLDGGDGSYNLEKMLNYEMVDLEEPDEDDKIFLLSAISAHTTFTGSVVGKRLLDNRESSINSFLKVMPKDYRRVIAATNRAIQEGIPVEEAVMAASHG
ncbi:MAG: glutamate synthase large subunit [Actinobacteria bacterium]|nr:glutamate synthase large subunit [Actinomycetota bacterium]MCL6104199.1 glutamate synthase large subunit [Actinomycetota bacterium]